MSQEELEIDSIEDVYEIEKQKRQYFNIDRTDYKNNLTLFFRGQADYSWKLEPSILRYKNIQEWEEIKGYDPNTDNLVAYIAKCQHFGKKTRFLDFTTDINIALFFACKDLSNKDASLFICPYIPRKMNWSDSIIISELALLKNEIKLQDFTGDLFIKYPEFNSYYKDTADLCTRIVSWLDHGFIVLPDKEEYETMKIINKRIYDQKGAFFICGNKTKQPLNSHNRSSSCARYNIILPEICDVPNTMQSSKFVIKVKIPATMKNSILEYLGKKGINEKYLMG